MASQENAPMGARYVAHKIVKYFLYKGLSVPVW